ncbi:sulfate adenylyltransferase subunit 1 [Flaviaesturariibacter amylovorans]|uniref:sulfate adenylyltransferase n=1 Tax=Flaviaesturariibacter amylovorans TaxID=1084520 RepID=A0ABP8H0J0_9BACT
MDILRIATAGSVDDGKSTLIGRLLHDTGSIAKDKLEGLEATSRRKGLDFTDLSLLTDGLIAEREQGITIDVAHIYFATAQRKYIIADTPGHIEYTRNMITGASNAQASIVLIDARNGVIEQTRRHLFISALLRLGHVFVCVNKMDLVQFDENAFRRIERDMKALVQKIGYAGVVHFIPIAAKDGDNVVRASAQTPWYTGPTLLHLLESIPVLQAEPDLPARFPVQLVIRPHSDEYHDYRGYAGKLASGTLTQHEEVLVLPSLKQTRIKSIRSGMSPVPVALPGQSVAIELADDVDVSRGSVIVSAHTPHRQLQAFSAVLNWMDETPLTSGKSYLLQHGGTRVKAKATAVQSVLDITTMEQQEAPGSLRLNDIGTVEIKVARPIAADPFAENRATGSFILIDEFSNNTVAVGFIGASR